MIKKNLWNFRNKKSYYSLEIKSNFFTVAATDMTYFARRKFSGNLVHKLLFFLLDILLKKVRYLFWVWMISEKSFERQLFLANFANKQNCQKLKQVYAKNSTINFWYSFDQLYWSFVYIFVWNLISNWMKEILHITKYCKGKNKDKEMHFHLFQMLIDKSNLF